MTPLKTVACITLLATIVGLVTAIPAPQDIATGEQNRLTDESRKTNEETSTQFNEYNYFEFDKPCSSDEDCQEICWMWTKPIPTCGNPFH